ncbi:MAG: D-glycero-alpha-D-manno-heptose-1,7-bisphosphate 7-phosphatase [Phycisphaerales bacterium]
MSRRAAIFLDRDDTLIDTKGATAGTAHAGDLVDPAKVRLLPNAIEGCRLLRDLGFLLVLISNQGCVARGRATIRQVEAVNDRVRALLFDEGRGVRLAGIYFCPHHPEAVVPAFHGDHAWRKPRPGMYLAACAELDLSIKDCWAIGDAARDVMSGVTAGIESARAIIVGKGHGIWYPDVKAAAEVIAAGTRPRS